MRPAMDTSAIDLDLRTAPLPAATHVLVRIPK
jgi:hypothetical protein